MREAAHEGSHASHGDAEKSEIKREVAPYAGVSWLIRFGEAVNLARAEGEVAYEVLFVLGVRLWR